MKAQNFTSTLAVLTTPLCCCPWNGKSRFLRPPRSPPSQQEALRKHPLQRSDVGLISMFNQILHCGGFYPSQ